MKDAPEFVVLAIKRGCVTDYLLELFEKGIPVLTETPPGESQEDLQKLWSAYEKYQPSLKSRLLSSIFCSRCMHPGIKPLQT